MKTFDKSSKLEHVAYDIRGPVLDEANRMIAKGEKILRLNTGNPAEFGFTAPDEVIRDLIMNVRNSEGYSDSKGIFSARKAIMQYCQLKGFPNVDIDDIYIGNGVSEMISISMQALLDDGDEVLVPMPDYPLWTACVSLAGGNAVHYVCDEKSNWYPDIDDIKSKITSNTKAIVVINPNNPTGALYPKDILEQIVDIARQNDLIIFAVLSGPKRNVKGYIEGLNMLANMRLCANVLSQHVIQTSLGGYQSVDELLIPGGRIYEQREFITNSVNAIPGLTAVKPDAGLYIFPKIDRNMYDIDDDEEFCLRLLKKEKVLLVPGKGFNWNEPDHFRIVYLPRVEELADLGNKIERVLSYYKR